MTYTTIHFPWKAAELSLFIYALKKKNQYLHFDLHYGRKEKSESKNL